MNKTVYCFDFLFMDSDKLKFQLFKRFPLFQQINGFLYYL